MISKMGWRSILIAIASLFIFSQVGHARDVTLSWNPNTESDLAGYKIYYDTDSGPSYNPAAEDRATSNPDGPPIVVGSDVTEVTITGFRNDRPYYLAITAFNDAGIESEYSLEVFLIPVSLFDMDSGNTQYTNDATVQLGLQGIPGNPHEMAVAEDTAFTVGSTGWLDFSTSPTFTFSNDSNEIKRVFVKFRDVAMNEVGWAISEIELDTIPPTDPSIASANPPINTAIDETTVSMTWNEGSDSGSGIAGYSWTVDQALTAMPDDQIEQEGLPQSVELSQGEGDYYVHVRTKDRSGNWTSTYHYGPWQRNGTSLNVNISYSTTSITNQNVVATLQASEPVTVTNNGGSTSYIFTQNGSFTFQFTDALGNSGSATATVDWIDKVAPTATLQYSTTEPTNQDVVVTLVPSETVTVTNNGGSTTKAFTENGTFTFEFVDGAGNTGSATAQVTNIDKSGVTYEITYQPTTLTNQDVVATITLSDGAVTSAGGNTHTFTENGSFTFQFTDAAGNSGSATATVDWIDKVAPTATLQYSTTEPTNQDVVVTLVPSETVTVTNNGGSTTKAFTENGTFTFEFVDGAGNTGSATAQVTNIDKSGVTYEITYQPTTLTNQDVVATITLSDGAVTSAGGNTHTFTENGSFTFEFTDGAGNSGSATANVDWIDKVAPAATLQYSTIEPTNQDVVVTLVPSETVTVTNNGGSTTKTFTENGTFTFEFVDGAGNTGSATALVSNVDKLAPSVVGIATSKADGAYRQNAQIPVTITFSEPVTLSGGSLVVSLDTGRSLTIDSIESSMTGSAVYTVQPGENSSALTVTSIALPRNGSLKDAAGNETDLSLPLGENLSDNHHIVIDTVAPEIQEHPSTDFANGWIYVHFSEDGIQNATVEGNYVFNPALSFLTAGGSDDIVSVESNIYRLALTSIPPYTIFTLILENITDRAGNLLVKSQVQVNDDDGDGMPDDWEAANGVDSPVDDPDQDGLVNLDEFVQGTEPGNPDTDHDGLPDGWEVDYGIDPTTGAGDDGPDGDFDHDGWSNLEEYEGGTIPADPSSPGSGAPKIASAMPSQSAGILNNTRVPKNTSFAVQIDSPNGIDITQMDSLKVTADFGVGRYYERDLRDTKVIRVVKLAAEDNSQVKKLWFVYDLAKDSNVSSAYGTKLNIKVDAKDGNQQVMTQESYDFRIETEAQHFDAISSLPDTEMYMTGDSTLDAGIEVTSGALQGAKIHYDSGEPVPPEFGPVGEIPAVDFSAFPLNLQPPTAFNTPVKVFIPLPGLKNVQKLPVYVYKGGNWVMACDEKGEVLPGGEGFVVPGSRVNHNGEHPPMIEIQVYHTAAVLAGLPREMTLKEAMKVEETCAGVPTSLTTNEASDVNGDQRVGIEEAIFLLQKASGLR